MDRFDYFVIFAGMRTGSNFLERNLNAVPDVKSHGELFNPYFIAHERDTEVLGFTLARREAEPMALVETVKADGRGIAGFRMFHDHDARVRAAVLADPRCAKIILTRNPVEAYVSWKQAEAADQWILTDADGRRDAQARFDMAEYSVEATARQAFLADVRHALRVTGQTAFELGYDDLRDLDVVNGVLKFLGSRHVLPRLDQSLKKQNPAPLRDRVANYDEMTRALAALDPLGLEVEPVFEPDRGPAVRHHRVLDAPAVIDMGLGHAGPDPVGDWLAAQGPVRTGLGQKDLRAWMRDNPDHRKVAVLAHPVDRAFAAFRHLILPHDLNAFADLRAGLVGLYGVALPDRYDPDSLPPEQLHAGFVAFLKFLKANLSGQTSLRIDRAWASQLASLQGMAQVILPDRIVRPEELAVLPRLLGLSGPGPVVLPDPALAAIYDNQIEKAARAAYPRDYLVFGFADWRG